MNNTPQIINFDALKATILWQYSPAPKTQTPLKTNLAQAQSGKKTFFIIITVVSSLTLISFSLAARLLQPEASFFDILRLLFQLNGDIFLALLLSFFFALFLSLPINIFFSYLSYRQDVNTDKRQTAEIKRQAHKKYALTADKFYLLLPTLHQNTDFKIDKTLDTAKIDAIRLIPEGLAIYSGSSAPAFSLDLPQSEAIELKKILLALRPDNMLDADKH